MGQSHNQTDLRYYKPIWALWLRWVLVTSIRGAIAWAVTAASGVFSLGVGLVGAGIITGFCLGWAQKELLRREIPNRDWSRWMGSSILGGTLTWLVAAGLGLSVVAFDHSLRLNPILPVGVYLLAGTVYGLAQSLALRSVRMRLWWILANAIGWSVGAFVGLNTAQAIIPFQEEAVVYSVPHAIYALLAGAIGTAVFAAITGIALIALFRPVRSSVA